MANSLLASTVSATLSSAPSSSSAHRLRHSFSSSVSPPFYALPSPRRFASLRTPKASYSNSLRGSGGSKRNGICDRLGAIYSSDVRVDGDSGGEGTGAPPMVLERFHSVISQLFQHRIVRCGGPLYDEMAGIIVAQLLYLDGVDPNKDIVMYINSPGGSVSAGMAIFDTMRHIRADVSTVCVGLASSMGAFLLSAGTKGKRYSLPSSRIMIHQPLTGAQGQQSSFQVELQEILYQKASLCGYLAYNTGQSLEKILGDTDNDYYMSAREAKEYGLIDGIIMNPHKALQLLPAT